VSCNDVGPCQSDMLNEIIGKTIQVISLIALLREQEQYYGPHLVIAPLSTLSNWQDEFQKWTPDIPFVLYHGTPDERQALFKNKIMRHYQKGRPSDKFPIICTSYEMVLRDHANLTRIDWAFIVIVSWPQSSALGCST